MQAMATCCLCTRQWSDWNMHVDMMSEVEKEQKKVTEVIYKLGIFFIESDKVFISLKGIDFVIVDTKYLQRKEILSTAAFLM